MVIDFDFSSSLMNQRCERILPDYKERQERAVAMLEKVESPEEYARSGSEE